MELNTNYAAHVVADSVSEHRKRITTFVLTYPRFIHSEILTHRLFSRNAMSSRAVPVNTMIQHVKQNTAKPIHWGKNQPGMQAKAEHDADVKIDLNHLCGGLEYTVDRESAWNEARDFAIAVAKGFHEAGYHKQIVNRILEPFQLMRTVVTSTEYDNWYWLRNHEDAQPEIKHLAELMLEQQNAVVPKILSSEEWHVPFYKSGVWSGLYENDEGVEVDRYGFTLDDALAISASCCAQASFRKADESIEKARDIYQRLVGMEPPHYSPFEHQAKPMKEPTHSDNDWEAGCTHIDINGNMWSGNFKGWIQNRQLLHIKLNHKYMTVK